MVNGATNYYNRPSVSALGQQSGMPAGMSPAMPTNLPTTTVTPTMPEKGDLTFALVQEMRIKRGLPLTPPEQERYDRIAAQVKTVMASKPSTGATADATAATPGATNETATAAKAPEARAVNGLSKDDVAWALEFEKKASQSGAVTKEQLYANFPKEEVDRYLKIVEQIQQKPTFTSKVKDAARNLWDKFKGIFSSKK